MIQYIILAILSLLGMAKKGGRRQRVIPLRVDHQLSVAAPATGAITTAVLADTVINRMYLISFKGVVAFRDNTAQEGPLYVGLAHSDYTDAEILEWYNAQGSWDQGDLVAQEQGRRKCRKIGIFDGELANENLNNGIEVTVPLRMIVEEGATLELFSVNEGGATRTTGGVVELHGTVWAKNA